MKKVADRRKRNAANNPYGGIGAPIAGRGAKRGCVAADAAVVNLVAPSSHQHQPQAPGSYTSLEEEHAKARTSPAGDPAAAPHGVGTSPGAAERVAGGAEESCGFGRSPAPWQIANNILQIFAHASVIKHETRRSIQEASTRKGIGVIGKINSITYRCLKER